MAEQMINKPLRTKEVMGGQGAKGGQGPVVDMKHLFPALPSSPLSHPFTLLVARHTFSIVRSCGSF